MSKIDLDDIRLSVSKTFDIQDKHVKVAAYAERDEAGFVVSINHADMSILNFKLLSERASEKVECAIFGLEVSQCGLDPKLPPCEGCPLNV